MAPHFVTVRGVDGAVFVTNVAFEGFLPRFSILEAAPSPVAQALEGREISVLP